MSSMGTGTPGELEVSFMFYNCLHICVRPSGAALDFKNATFGSASWIQDPFEKMSTVKNALHRAWPHVDINYL
jgi:hypothetical protein